MRVFLNKEGRDIIKKGIDCSVDVIKSTLGGSGKTFVLYSGGQIGISKDGVSASRSLVLEGDLNIGATLIRNATEKQLETSGDGTSAAAVLTQKMIELGFNEIDKKVSQIDLKAGMDKAIDICSKKLSQMAIKIVSEDDTPETTHEKIKNIATISANNDSEIGQLIADAFKEVGHDGDLFIEQSKTYQTYVNVQSGFKIDRGYLSPLFAEQETMQAELINPYIVLFEGKIDKWGQLKTLMDGIMEAKASRDILIICDNVEGEALQTLVVNRLKKVINVVCVQAPYFGEKRKYAMQDMAIITGGTYMSTDIGISTMTIAQTGTCEKVLVTKNDTTIIGGKGDKIEIEKISSQIDALLVQAENEYEKTMLKQRKARVKGKLSVISVGAPTEIEMKEKTDRVDDSIRSVKSAIEGGVLPGGGVALLRCVETLKETVLNNYDQQRGLNIVRKALEAPLRQILHNSGIVKDKVFFGFGESKDRVVNALLKLEDNYGYDVKSGEIKDMIAAGIIDACKVVESSLVTAGSVAGIVLTAESLIC